MNCNKSLPCTSLSPRVYSNSFPLSQWCYLIILSSVTLFSSRPQSFPSLGSFPMSWLFASSDGHSIGASAPVLPMNIQGWFPWGLTDLMSLCPRTLKSLLWHHSLKASVLRRSAFFMIQLSYLYMTTGKTVALTKWTFDGKVMSLLFNTLNFSSKGQASFNFVAAITIHSDFGAQEKKMSLL